MTLFRFPPARRASLTLVSSFKKASTNTNNNAPVGVATIAANASTSSINFSSSYSIPAGLRYYSAMTVDIPRILSNKSSTSQQTHTNNFVKIVEVGPRDGLQNEKNVVPTQTKLALIEKLSHTGLQVIEAGAFVSPKWVPQMADTPQILQHLDKHPASASAASSSPAAAVAAATAEGITYPYLVPNIQGLNRALDLGTANLKEVAIFASASEGFSKKNINCSIAESLERFRPVLELCHDRGIRVRGYISMVISCPYDGPTPPSTVAEVTQRLLEMGCYEISLGDTNGTGTPATVSRLLTTLLNKPYSIPVQKIACHFHDTYNQALVNAMTALCYGVRVFDSSVAGLGGCPYAKGATGNVSTEDLVYCLHGMGMETGVDLERISEIGEWISKELGRGNGSKVGPALLNRKKGEDEKKAKRELEKETEKEAKMSN